MSSILPWLGRPVLALLVVVGLPQFAHANFIDLVSQSYRIHAMGDLEHGPVVDYDETSVTPPLSRTDEFFQGGPFGGFFMLQASADGGSTPASAFVQAVTSSMDAGFGTARIAEASAAITFRPLVSNVVVQIGNPWIPFPFANGFGFSQLFDDTADAVVLALGSPYTPAAYNVSLNLEHLYTISASSNTGFERGVTLGISPVGPAYVPESESTLTFFVLGLGALRLVARSPKFHPSRRISHT